MSKRRSEVSQRRDGLKENDINSLAKLRNRVTDELDSSLGIYVLNQALIRLERDVNVLTAQGDEEISTSRLAVLCHEYAHYLHNFSTPTGAYQFVAQLRLLRLFINTVDGSGKSGGSELLDARAATHLAACLTWFNHLKGTHFRLQSQDALELGTVLVNTTASADFDNEKLDLASVQATFNARVSGVLTEVGMCTVGSTVICEGLAWEVERMIHVAMAETTELVDEGTPQSPYKLARCLFEGITKKLPDSETMAKILLLALFSTDPGCALVDIAETIKDCGDQSIEESLKFVVQNRSPAKYIDHAIELLQSEIAGFEKSGPAGRGIAALAERSIALLKARKGDLFFEIDAFQQIVEPDVLQNLISKYPPCPILQVEESSVGLVLVGQANHDRTKLDELAAAQGMMQFMGSHLAMTRIVSTEQARPSPCRFFGACGLPGSSDPSGPCNSEPWTKFDPQSREGCWYAAGVSSSLGYQSGPEA
jgi:hypothetical protein